MGVAAGEEQSVVGKIFKGRHVGELDACAGGIVKFRGIDPPVIEDEKKNVAGAGDGVAFDRIDGAIDESGVAADSEGGIIEVNFGEASLGVIGDDGGGNPSDSDGADRCGRKRRGGEIEEEGDTGDDGEILDDGLIEVSEASELGTVELLGETPDGAP